MSTINQSNITRLTKEIATLRQADAREAEKEANLLAKANRAQEAASRTKSPSTAQTKMKELERASKDMASIQKKRSSIAGRIAQKTSDLTRYQQHQARDDEKARKKIADEQKRLIREREAHERRIKSEVLSRSAQTQKRYDHNTDEYDFFISHASEDKDGFVRELAEALRDKGARVWYDEFSLKIGDSLRRNIDQGLASSRFGVVILSESFFRKEWPNKELDGLTALEVTGETRVLPIWHKVSKDEVAQYSPMLADKVALNTSLKAIDEIADELIGLLK
ncbi:toll/interleukin-1 receptor domain-containing protein [Parvularcula marina]|uniref:ADP-ribosyl cyclase/cyclic ADP-ribose hydrolase n=1 Tax=Parvularcula marina TaxID=2292771 RepID=A0A371RH57_9PROT|nr:toll/interleukin-1 receptor domain-containing protein [Parvularcula marina]RFB04776.1 toll/interleukin-1 receptor domain-containing protein [Parvularcula marina]